MPYYGKPRRRQPARRRRAPKKPIKKLVEGTGSTWLDRISNGIGATASLARAIAPYIHASNAELKYCDLVTNISPLLGTFGITPIMTVAQGTDDTNRVGNSIKCKDVNIRVQITGNFATQSYNLVRCILLVDKMQNGTAPTAPQIFESSGSYQSAFNKDTTDRFTIVFDKLYTLTQNNNAAIQDKIYKKLDFHVRYIGTSAAAASLGPNQLYLITHCAQAGNPPAVTYYTRVNYYDD